MFGISDWCLCIKHCTVTIEFDPLLWKSFVRFANLVSINSLRLFPLQCVYSTATHYVAKIKGGIITVAIFKNKITWICIENHPILIWCSLFLFCLIFIVSFRKDRNKSTHACVTSSGSHTKSHRFLFFGMQCAYFDLCKTWIFTGSSHHEKSMQTCMVFHFANLSYICSNNTSDKFKTKFFMKNVRKIVEKKSNKIE